MSLLESRLINTRFTQRALREQLKNAIYQGVKDEHQNIIDTLSRNKVNYNTIDKIETLLDKSLDGATEIVLRLAVNSTTTSVEIEKLTEEIWRESTWNKDFTYDFRRG